MNALVHDTMAPAAAKTVVRVVGGSKTYQGVHALRDVDFNLFKGEIHALMGENGAGKSTLSKAIAGVIQLSGGIIEVDGQKAAFTSPSDALAAGISMVYQETSLVPTMTVAQNLYLGREPAFASLRQVVIRAQQILQSMGFHVDPRAVVARLSAAQKQMVEIARAVLHKARVIIFDEPTATLTPEEKQHFFSLVAKLKRQGVAIVFISHAIEEALDLADRITVLRDGQKVITSPVSALNRASVVHAMVGRAVEGDQQTDKGRGSGRRRGHKLLSVENVVMGDIVKNTSFSIFAGEISCIAGLIGSGRTEMMKIVAGALKRDLLFGGTIVFEGKTVRYRVPAQAVRDGIVYVTEDRKLNGFFELMSIEENIYLGWLTARGGSLVSRSQGKIVAGEWLKRLSIRSINADARVNELSGGNQQKVVIAKSLIQTPKLVIFDEPTRGVDVGAIAEIHAFIRHLAEQGVAVVVISSYLPEVLALGDRVLVVRQGRVVEEFDAAEASEEKIMFAAVH